MKKFCIVVMIFFLLAVSVKPVMAIAGYVVAAIAAGSLMIAGSSVLIPALVNGPSNKSGWVSLAVSMSNAASVAATVSMAGILAGHTILKNAMSSFVGTSRGLTSINGSTVGYNVTTYPAPGTLNPGWPYTFTGFYSTRAAAVASLGGLSGVYDGIFQGYTCVHNYTQGPAPSYVVTHWLAVVGTASTTPIVIFTPYTSGTLASELSTAAAAGDQAAQNVLREAWNELHENMAGRSNSLTPTIINDAKTVLNNSVTQAQADTIAGVVPRTPEEIAADAGTAAITEAQIRAAIIAALSAQGLSASQIAAALAAVMGGGQSLTQAQVQAAMTAALAAANPNLTQAQVQAAVAAAMAGNPNLTAAQVQAAIEAAMAAHPALTAAQVQAAVDAAIKANPAIIPAYTGAQLPAAYVQPAVGDFQTRTQAFVDTIKASSIFGLPVLLGSSIPSSGGSCEYTVDMSERFGGTKTLSFCNWSTGLAAIHVVLMILAGWTAVRIVSKGGG